jgi:hypothetical protein
LKKKDEKLKFLEVKDKNVHIKVLQDKSKKIRTILIPWGQVATLGGGRSGIALKTKA